MHAYFPSNSRLTSILTRLFDDLGMQFQTLIFRIDFYALLDIEKTAGESEIKKAYFKKSKEYHPDR